MDDSEDDDSGFDPVIFVGGATAAIPTRRFLHMQEVGEVSFAPKDGNCLYHALGAATGHPMQEMRNLAAAFVAQNAEHEYNETGMTWKSRVCTEYERDIEESLDLMRHNAYGGGLEVEALGHTLGRDIAIYEKVSNNQTGEIYGYSLLQGPAIHDGDVTAEPIWLLWTRGASEAGNHYDLLLQPKPPLAHEKTTTAATTDSAPLPTRTYASVVRGTTSTPTKTRVITATAPSKASTTPTSKPMRTFPSVVATTSNNPITAYNATPDENDGSDRVARIEPTTPQQPRHDSKQQHFYLDSGASEHLFDPSAAVTDKSPRTIAVTGISGTIQATTGKHATFGRVLINPNAKGRNLVSLANLRNTHEVSYDGRRDTFVAERNGKQLIFKSKRKLYTLVEPAIVLHAGAHQQYRIQRVLELHDSLHHPSDEVLIRCLDDQTFEHDCTSADLKAARELLGPCKACLAGKYTTPPAPQSAPKTWLPGACLEVDILFIASGTGAKIPFLLGVDAGSGAATAREIPDRRTPTLITGLLAIVAVFNLHSKRKVTEIKADNETGFQSAVDTLTGEGIRLRIMPTERHARQAERTIRELKDYMRCTIAGLNFKLPTTLFRLLLLDTVLTRNVISHRRKSKSPREILTGTKPNVMEDFRHRFGTVGFTQVSASALIHDMFPRAELAVVVGHYVNERGAVMVWLPRSNRVVKRHSIKPVAVDSTTKALLETVSSEHVTLDFTLETTFGPPIPSAQPDLQDPTGENDTTDVHHPPIPVLPPPAADAPGPTTPPTAPEPSPTSPTTTSTSPPPSSSADPDVPGVSEVPHHPDSLAVPHATGDCSASEPPGKVTPSSLPPPGPEPRRSTRERRPPAKLRDEPSSYQAFQAAGVQPLHPDGNLTVRQAMTQDPAAAQAALEAEIQQMLKLSVIGRRDPAIPDTILPSKMFLKWKSDGILKARLVIGGHMQDKANMGDTYSPTVNTESVNVLLTIAWAYKIKPHTVDVSGAFLHVPLRGKPVHMRLNRNVSQIVTQLAPAFIPDVQEDGKLVVRIRKAIYGLGESSRQWSDHLAETLRKAGYTRLRYDRSAYIKFSKTSRPASILCTHVDDILIVDFEGHHRQQLVEALTKAYGPVKQQGGPNLTYLGVHIEKTDHGFLLHQRPLLEQLEYRPPRRRSRAPVPLDLLDAPQPNSDAQDPDHFRSTLMRLLYVSSKTRFDLMFAVNVLATRQQNCTTRDEEALAQLVQFAKDTKDWSLRICPPTGSLILEASADARYACHPDGRGQTGIVCSLGNTTVFARSGKQKLTAKSSTEAELLALNQATDEVLYLRNLLTELGFPQVDPTTILQDNQSAITMALKGELGTKRTKHFTVRHYFMTEHLHARNIALRYHPGKQINADGLTKPLAGPQFQRWARRLLNNEDPSSPDPDTDSSELAGACYTIPSGRFPLKSTV